MAGSLFDPPSRDEVQSALGSIWQAMKSKGQQAMDFDGNLRRQYQTALAAANGDKDAQAEVAGNSLGAAMGSLGVEGKAAKAAAGESAALDMSEAARMARAKAMGFNTDTPMYHGTKADIQAFQDKPALNGQAYGKGIYLAERPKDASDYATGFVRSSTEGRDGANVLPLYAKMETPFNLDHPVNKDLLAEMVSKRVVPKARAESIDDNFSLYGHMINKLSPEKFTAVLQKYGYDSVQAPHVKTNVVFEPSQIRSTFAKFDPSKAGSGNLSAAIAATTGAGLLGAGALQSQDASASNLFAPPTQDERADFMASKPSQKGIAR